MAYYGSRYRHEEPLLVYYILGALSDRVHNYDSNTTSACEAKMEPVKNLQNYCHTIYMVSSAVKIISHDLWAMCTSRLSTFHGVPPQSCMRTDLLQSHWSMREQEAKSTSCPEKFFSRDVPFQFIQNTLTWSLIRVVNIIDWRHISSKASARPWKSVPTS